MKKYQLAKSFFYTIPNGVHALTMGSIFILVLKKLILDRFPQPITGMHSGGMVLESILASVIASYIFYLFVVHIPYVREKISNRDYISDWCSNIINSTHNTFSELLKAANVNWTIANDKAKTKNALSNVNAFSQNSPLVHPQNFNLKLNWLEYLYNFSVNNNHNLKKLLSQGNQIDPKLMKIIINLSDSDVLQLPEMLLNTKIATMDLGAISDAYYDYYQLTLELKKHLNDSPWLYHKSK